MEVSEEELFKVLMELRDLRARHLRRRGSPWALRQAFIIVLTLDTAAALERGVPPENLQGFDAVAQADAQEWVRRRG